MKYLTLLLTLSAFHVHAGNFNFYPGVTDPENDRLLDTRSGKLWKKSCVAMINANGKCTAYIWVPEIIEGINSQTERAQYIKREQEIVESINKQK